jgi:hypothetical protein
MRVECIQGSAIVEGLSVHATGPSISQDTSPTTLILQSLDHHCLVKYPGALFSMKMSCDLISETLVKRSKFPHILGLL